MPARLSPVQVAGLLAVACSLAAGQVLFKLAARTLVVDQGLAALAKSLWSWQLALALSVYGASTLGWLLLLVSVPLSRAYPFAALAFVLVPVLAGLCFGEQLTPAYWLGLALVLAGLVLVALGPT